MALAYVFAKCGMYSKKGGGMGGYVEYSFGKAGNFLANYTYGVSLIFANTAIAISAVGYALGFLGTTLDPVMTCAATVFTLWLATTPHSSLDLEVDLHAGSLENAIRVTGDCGFLIPNP